MRWTLWQTVAVARQNYEAEVRRGSDAAAWRQQELDKLAAAVQLAEGVRAVVVACEVERQESVLHGAMDLLRDSKVAALFAVAADGAAAQLSLGEGESEVSGAWGEPTHRSTHLLALAVCCSVGGVVRVQLLSWAPRTLTW
jgi:hypothetical protein